MRRWKWLIVLGVAVGVLGLDARMTWGDAAMTPKQIDKEWKRWKKELAKRRLPPPKPVLTPAEREQRAATAAQTIKDICVLLKQSTVSAREIVERFGTVDSDENDGEIVFQTRDPAFQQPSNNTWMAEVHGGLSPGAVTRVQLHTADNDQLMLPDLERVFGKGRVLGRSFPGDLVEFTEPSAEGPMHCRIWVDTEASVGEPKVPISFIALERGSYDAEGNFWLASFKIPTECVWCLGSRKATR